MLITVGRKAHDIINMLLHFIFCCFNPCLLSAHKLLNLFFGHTQRRYNFYFISCHHDPGTLSTLTSTNLIIFLLTHFIRLSDNSYSEKKFLASAQTNRQARSHCSSNAIHGNPHIYRLCSEKHCQYSNSQQHRCHRQSGYSS